MFASGQNWGNWTNQSGLPVERSTRRAARQLKFVLIWPQVTSSPIFGTVRSWNCWLERHAIENTRENFEDRPEENFPKAQMSN